MQVRSMSNGVLWLMTWFKVRPSFSKVICPIHNGTLETLFIKNKWDTFYCFSENWIFSILVSQWEWITAEKAKQIDKKRKIKKITISLFLLFRSIGSTVSVVNWSWTHFNFKLKKGVLFFFWTREFKH